MLMNQRRQASRRREGQALLVAVLLMMVILLTGILFVALVAYNQQQSARSVDVNTAQGLAEAGIRWCNENLTNSPQGADWRPPFRPFNAATYDANDRDTWPVPPVMDTDGNAFGVYGPDRTPNTEQDYYREFELARGWHGLVDATTGEYLRYGFYRIPDLNSTPQDVELPTEAGSIAGKGHIWVRVTYNPNPPYEDRLSEAAIRRPDEMSANIKIESIGVVDDDVPVFRYLQAYKPIGLTDYVLFVTDKDRTGRPAKLGFNPRLHMHNDEEVHWLSQDWYGPMRFNPRLELTGDYSSTRLALTPRPTEAVLEVPGVNPPVVTGGYLRMDRLEAAGGISEPTPSPPLHSAAVYERDEAGEFTPLGYVSTTGDTLGGLVLDGEQATDADGYSRHTRRLSPPRLFEGGAAERYRALSRDSGDIVNGINLGKYGFGRGVYVDNRGERQFVREDGSSDIRALINDWMQVFHAGRHSAQDSGWNPTYTTYTAPGVEITLFPSEAAALDFWQLTPTDIPSNQPQTVWWPGHVAGEPGIRLTRHDRTWLWYNPVSDAIEDSGEMTMYVDYPAYPNQVVFAEGNVRVRGALPPRDVNAPDSYRDYNLTIVSGGTIYIDGQILSPQDMLGRDAGSGSAPSGGELPDEYNTKVALLARDCVALNPTRIVPQLTSGTISAEPDDPFNPRWDEQHWVLSPEVSGSAYSSWTFGERLPDDHRVSLVVQHTAVDPGPAAISMSIFDGMTSTWTRFDFGGIWNPEKFYFVQPGLAPPPPPPHSNVETTLTPDWSWPYSPEDPVLPWDIRGYLDDAPGYPVPGVLKAVAISRADPALAGLGGGATEYWLKRWKLHQTTGAGDPIGGVHAKVNALIYAENGCWFVIPGDHFDPRQSGVLARHFRRYNYDICVRGAITENFRAEPEMVREWSDKWAWPLPGGGWATIRYEFDESLRDNRDPRDLRISTLSGNERFTHSASTPLPGHDGVSASPKSNLPRLPLLPVSPDLIFFGEGM